VRTIIELPQEQLDALESVCRRDGISRAEAIRRAIAHHVRDGRASTRDRAFGLWRGRRLDGVTYQRRLRREWDR